MPTCTSKAIRRRQFVMDVIALPASTILLDQLAVFGQVVLIDLVLAADNAIVVGALAAGLPAAQRRGVILIGIGAAFGLRVVFALGVGQLLHLIGLILAGGLLLLWVAWKLWRELRQQPAHPDAMAVVVPKSFAAAAWSVALADVSMSLDNVLAVAGAAREHPMILVTGLVLSVALMGLAADLIARYIERFRWIGFVGLAVVVYVAFKMIREGYQQVAPLLG